MTTYEYPIKCLDCGLHYTVWSWNEDWHEKNTAHCPECGRDEHYIGFPIKARDEQIFQLVPGMSEADQRRASAAATT